MGRIWPIWGKRTHIMGIINVTPDSFSGDGLPDAASALAQAQMFVAAGATFLDIGGESTRPNATPVSQADELARVVPVIETLRRWSAHLSDPPILSIDTYKPAVAEVALGVGATVINDITGLRDPQMRNLAASSGAGVVIMHTRGTPQTMQSLATYADVVAEVGAELEHAVALALDAGVERAAIVVDPGIGFAKIAAHNLRLLRHLPDLKARLGLPMLVGVSRKGFIGGLLGDAPPHERGFGTAAAVALAIAGGADVVRVHDVAEMAQVARVAHAIVHAT